MTNLTRRTVIGERHGDADRLADQSEALGLPLVPWQRDFLNRIETASMNEQFSEIVRAEQNGT